MSKRKYEEYIENGCHPVGYNEPCQSYYFGQVSIDYILDQLDQQKAMWNELKEWLKKAILRNKDNIISKNDYENVLVIMQELEGEDE